MSSTQLKPDIYFYVVVMKSCFGTINIFEDKLYIQTGKVKKCYKEIIDNPNVEISAFYDGKWIRVSGKLVPDDREIAIKSMLDKYPDLRRMYNELDGNTIVLYFRTSDLSISIVLSSKILFAIVKILS